MLFTLTSRSKPATDLGYLLHKHPARCQSARFSYGAVKLFFPVAGEDECTFAMVLDINPVDLVRGRRHGGSSFQLEQYVNDRPYVCSSFFSVAMSRVLTQALNGSCKNQPDLVATPMDLTARLCVLPCRGGGAFLRSLFEPLGYEVIANRLELDEQFPDWGPSPYFDVALTARTTVKELLNHLHVLVPVLDNQKHYFVEKSEIEKLLTRGEGWLAEHPQRDIITRRYLKHKLSLAREALNRLMESSPVDEEIVDGGEVVEDAVEKAMNLNEERLGSVLSAIKATGAQSVIDLGCGEGKLLRLLLKEKQFRRICGMDVSIRSLEMASEKLRLKDLPPALKERVELIHGSLMYQDRRFKGFDVAAVVEVIEHLDMPRLRAFERVVFEKARPRAVVLTTPNREYNPVWENVGPDKLRHRDHRFEWTREEFQSWALGIAERFGYEARFLGIGPQHETFGTPTQMCVFTRVRDADEGGQEVQP